MEASINFLDKIQVLVSQNHQKLKIHAWITLKSSLKRSKMQWAQNGYYQNRTQKQTYQVYEQQQSNSRISNSSKSRSQMNSRISNNKSNNLKQLHPSGQIYIQPFYSPKSYQAYSSFAMEKPVFRKYMMDNDQIMQDESEFQDMIIERLEKIEQDLNKIKQTKSRKNTSRDKSHQTERINQSIYHSKNTHNNSAMGNYKITDRKKFNENKQKELNNSRQSVQQMMNNVNLKYIPMEHAIGSKVNINKIREIIQKDQKMTLSNKSSSSYGKRNEEEEYQNVSFDKYKTKFRAYQELKKVTKDVKYHFGNRESEDNSIRLTQNNKPRHIHYTPRGIDMKKMIIENKRITRQNGAREREELSLTSPANSLNVSRLSSASQLNNIQNYFE